MNYFILGHLKKGFLMIIKRKKANLYYNANLGLTFYPGNNFIDNDKIDAVKNEPRLKELVENGIHEIILEGDKTSKEKDPLKNIRKLPVSSVINIVKETYKKDILNTIAKNDKRQKVQDAVTNQIKRIDDQRKDKE